MYNKKYYVNFELGVLCSKESIYAKLHSNIKKTI